MRTLALAQGLDDPRELWEELESHWRRGSLVGLAPPEERCALMTAVVGPGAATTDPRQEPDGAGMPLPRDASAAPGPEAFREPAVVLGSGGSGGGRRWCLQPLAHLQASARACGAWLADQGIDPQRSLHLDALPLHHVSGLMPLIRARQWRAGLRWLPPALLRQPALLPQACPLPDDRPVLLSLVPTQLHRLLDCPEAHDWLRRCSVIWVGGSALGADLATRARAAALPLAPCYGATETAAMVCALPPRRFLAGEEGCGPPLNDVELRLEGEAGLIAVRGARLSPGWFAMGRLHPFRDRDGWWRSGDAGSWNSGAAAAAASDAEAHSLSIRGRLDGAIHSGGETVFPEQVRQSLLRLIHDAARPVQELLLLAEPDPLWGERLVALVRLRTPGDAAPDGITEQQELTRLTVLARALPPGQRPRRWLSCPTLAANEAGKWRLEQWRHWLRSQPAGLD